MIPEAYVAHCIPGRLRLKIPSKKGDSAYFSTLAAGILECPGVKNAAVNSLTGSLLLECEVDAATLSAYAKKQSLFSVRRALPRHKSLFVTVGEAFKNYNRRLVQLTNGEFDIPSLVFLSLMISGVVQILRGNIAMPAWYTAFYYSLSVFSRAHVDEYDEGEDLTEGIEDVEGEGLFEGFEDADGD
ncbi:MAG: HMA2 domain-containing protein [Thermodesulfobacteriota bacterium]